MQNAIIPVFQGREVGFMVDQVRARLVIVPETWREFGHGDMARALGAEALVLDYDGSPVPELRLPAGDPSVLPAPPTDLEEGRWIYYSSGTTQTPRAPATPTPRSRPARTASWTA